MTNNQIQDSIVKMVAPRGDLCRRYARSLLDGSWSQNPAATLRGRAKNYAAKYTLAWCGVISRLEDLGYFTSTELGPKGGMYSRRVRLTNVGECGF